MAAFIKIKDFKKVTNRKKFNLNIYNERIFER